MTCTTQIVIAALNANGYITDANDITKAVFVGEGRYRVTFPTDDGFATGYVFLSRNAEGVLVGEY
jgi:hypothetical protein